MNRSLQSAATLATLAASLLLSACNRGSPIPCTDCLAVKGTYRELAVNSQVDCGNARVLYFAGVSPRATAVVSQTGSQLSAAVLGTQLAGVLHADGSASLGPVSAVATSSDGTNPDTPGKLRLEGWFTATSSTVTGFDGTYLFIADEDGCELDAQVHWSR
jgi:hypothetical protein